MLSMLFIHNRTWARLKTLATLLALLVLLPFNATFVLIAWLVMKIRSLWRKPPSTQSSSRKVLLTGAKMTKSLQLARLFHAGGYQVYLVETHKYWLSGHRFSLAVSGFYTIPAPEKDPKGYCQGLLDIVQKEDIDVFIPVSSPVASYYDSLAKLVLSPHCEVFHLDPKITELLDNKFRFMEKAKEIGLSVPKSHLIKDRQQVLDFDFAADGSEYILKSIPYNSVTRLDLTRLPCENLEAYLSKLPISPEQPWIMQEFIQGQEYCTHSTIRQGELRVHCCSPSSPFQVNYQQVDKPLITAWVQKFAAELGITGQISFDFMETETGDVYPLECNPRTHSAITMFYNHPGIAQAYLEDSNGSESYPLQPLATTKPTYWLYHELWRLNEVRSWQDLQVWWQKITRGKDAIFDYNDPIPFLTVHHWQIPLLLLANLWKGNPWVRIDFNIGKLVEIGGD